MASVSDIIIWSSYWIAWISFLSSRAIHSRITLCAVQSLNVIVRIKYMKHEVQQKYPPNTILNTESWYRCRQLSNKVL